MGPALLGHARPEAGDGTGRLVENITHFGRVLRAAGLPVGPGRVVEAVKAVRAIGITDREIFYWALHAVFVNRRDQRELFDQAFHIFWRNPRILERMMQLILPTFRGAGGDEDAEVARRVAEALRPHGRGDGAEFHGEEVIELDAVMTWSDQETLRTKDFEKMSAEEIRRAKAAIAAMRLPLAEMPTRRFRPAERGSVDMRATLRASLRGGGQFLALARRTRRRRPPPLVVLCDISGSMERYSRMLLHFLHQLTSDRDRVHGFVFGTRLTNITRHLRHRDVDEALAKIGENVADWSGGTRIGHCLHCFNRDWSRRVLAQGAVVLLISDGLDRDAGDGLAAEADRLHRSCRRLIWLNPLLRFEGFAPRSHGVRALLPHVDDFRPAHSLDSLEQLADLLGRAESEHRAAPVPGRGPRRRRSPEPAVSAAFP